MTIHSENRKPRLAPLEPPYEAALADELARCMPPGVPPLKLFRTLAHNPRVLQRFRQGSLLDRGAIARVDRELVILRTCARCGSEYEWGVHVAVFAARYGLSPEVIDATATASGEATIWTPEQRRLIRLVDALHDFSVIPEDLWAELENAYPAAQLVEFVALVGFYHTVSFVTNAFGIEREAAAARFPRANGGFPGPV